MIKCHPKLGFYAKGPVSGFVGDIPLPTLDSRIQRNHIAGALFDFLVGFCHPSSHNMSEGFWLFDLKMAVQSLGKRDSTYR